MAKKEDTALYVTRACLLLGISGIVSGSTSGVVEVDVVSV